MERHRLQALHHLARLYDIQTAYNDIQGRRQQATGEALMAVLRLLGAPVNRLDDVPDALRERQQMLWQRTVEPVIVSVADRAVRLELRLPISLADEAVTCHMQLEQGEKQRHVVKLNRLPELQACDVEGQTYVLKRLTLPSVVPAGYHQLRLEVSGVMLRSLIISSPRKSFTDYPRMRPKAWGVFLPLFALHSEQSWGTASFSELESLIEWTAAQEGDIVATLPLLSTFLDEPYDPSPYAPASRLFWNEFYLDVMRVPELPGCPPAQALLASESFQFDLADLRSGTHVDYRRQMVLKRRVLEELAHSFFELPSARQADFHRFLKAHPGIEDYAAFRAVGERLKAPWPEWPQPLRQGTYHPGDYDARARNYHLYVQWLAHAQLAGVAEKARAAQVRLYLDVPLGVHPYSYDVWRERDAFVMGATVGAPPDPFFALGQDWGFPPLHPEAIREQGYRYPIAYLRHQFQHAGILRLDHIMSLHRLFCIPEGFPTDQGVYVRYNARELYAMVNLESHRHKTLVVGENLGTVPAQVTAEMTRRDLCGMYVLQFELNPDQAQVLRPVAPLTVASLDTHDTPMFGAFLQGLDIEDRYQLGLLDDATRQHECQTRKALKAAMVHYLSDHGWLRGKHHDDQAITNACMAYLAASPARQFLVNLEDLWLEAQPHNVPGTHAERPNWQRKARYSVTAFSQMQPVLATLALVNKLRKQKTRGDI